MADDQEIQEAKERVRALRQQLRAEQNDRAVASADAAKDVRLEALNEEERSLEAQLAAVRSVRRPGEVDETVVVPAGPGEGNVNVKGGPVRADQDPLAEGVPFREVVDAHGNLVREPITEEDATVELTPQGEAEGLPEVDPHDMGTREADPPPPDVDENATMTSRNKRR